MPAPDTKQAEKEYLGRTGSSIWERTKPFSPTGLDTLADSAQLLHDFSVAMLTLQPSADDLILDLGAGAGWCSDLLGRLNRSSVAVDLSMDMLRAARSRPGTAIRAAAGDMESLPFRSGVFQKVICLNALHHVPNVATAVREIVRVLDDTGVVLFSEPGLGHAEASVSTAAMRDFGVLEQDIVLERLMRDCRDAGFADVRVKPLSYSVPAFDLTLEQWQDWSRLAASTRPRRALTKIGLACAELLGLGKRGPLFEDTFAISLVRTLRLVVEHHPIVVASKRPFAPRNEFPLWRAEIAMDGPAEAPAGGFAKLTVHSRNTGAATWRPSSRSGIGHVTLGIQLLDDGGRLIARDHHRITLPHPVARGEQISVEVECPMPAAPGRYSLKCDLVVEGTTWFEASGSAAVARSIIVA